MRTNQNIVHQSRTACIMKTHYGKLQVLRLAINCENEWITMKNSSIMPQYIKKERFNFAISPLNLFQSIPSNFLNQHKQ